MLPAQPLSASDARTTLEKRLSFDAPGLSTWPEGVNISSRSILSRTATWTVQEQGSSSNLSGFLGFRARSLRWCIHAIPARVPERSTRLGRELPDSPGALASRVRVASHAHAAALQLGACRRSVSQCLIVALRSRCVSISSTLLLKTYRRTQTSSGRRVIVCRDEHRIVHPAGTAFGRTFRMDLHSARWALLAPVRHAGVASPMSAGSEELTSCACDAHVRVGIPHGDRRWLWSAQVGRLSGCAIQRGCPR